MHPHASHARETVMHVTSYHSTLCYSGLRTLSRDVGSEWRYELAV